MGGLQRILKATGSMIVESSDGKKETWIWDYINDKPRKKSEMTKEEIAENEKAKWMSIKDQIKKNS